MIGYLQVCFSTFNKWEFNVVVTEFNTLMFTFAF